MFLGQHSIATENTIMGDAPIPIERRLILPTLDGMSFGDLRYIADSIAEYAGEVQVALEQRREERIEELKAQVEADKARAAATEAELAALQPQPAKVANPSTPKYRDPAKPENTWAGRGKMPGWLKKKQEEGASLEDFLVDKPTVPSSTDDPGF
ncbi:MAG: H-NS histone family protein [Vampirovibrionales bacterium]|nr:H-NS histone family protein [Vampirovibrionales bacterium]MBK8191555.1 H-NS histone family protein [Vampirovibrionales bacterium]